MFYLIKPYFCVHDLLVMKPMMHEEPSDFMKIFSWGLRLLKTSQNQEDVPI